MTYDEVFEVICKQLRDHFDCPPVHYSPSVSIHELDPNGLIDDFDVIEISLILDDVFEVDTETEHEVWSDLDDIVTTYQTLLNEKSPAEVNETMTTERKYETEIIRRIYDNTEGKYIQVAPDPDLPEVIVVSHTGDFWSNFRFAIEKDMAIELANALLGTASEVKE